MRIKFDWNIKDIMKVVEEYEIELTNNLPSFLPEKLRKGRK